jgi:threonylcarbamoyladenosine tRNA methylthiotransferase MtaB
VAWGDPADVCIINTCTVTQVAEKKSRNMLRRAVAANPNAFVAATGCYVQMKPEEAEQIPGIDLLLGANEKHKLFELAAAGAERKAANEASAEIVVAPATDALEYREIGNINSRTSRTRAFVKIEDGCNQFCSYCIVPHVRGPVRSRPKQAVLAEIAALVAEGYKEIVLTGIHTGAYGTDFGEKHGFAELVEAAAEIPGLVRLRLGSVEPHEISDRLLALAAANPVICPHFHVPLQAAHDEILRLMGRTYDTAFYRDLLARIRETVPHAAVMTDMIAGFPGETEEIFESELALVRELAFADAHIFPYSRRPGTPAADFPNQVLNATKNERAARLAAVVAETREKFRGSYLGRPLQFLAEQQAEREGVSGMLGYTANYLPIFVPGLAEAAGQIIEVVPERLLDRADGGELLAHIK